MGLQDACRVTGVSLEVGCSPLLVSPEKADTLTTLGTFYMGERETHRVFRVIHLDH